MVSILLSYLEAKSVTYAASRLLPGHELISLIDLGQARKSTREDHLEILERQGWAVSRGYPESTGRRESRQVSDI
jgi:hypothetical protein